MATTFEIIGDYGDIWPKYCTGLVYRPMPYSRDSSPHPLRQVNELTKSAIKRFDAREKEEKGSMVTFERRFLSPVNAADVNYFDKLHLESVVLAAPGEIAQDLRTLW